tara:strand:+ start:288 stop:917 length:630 start_codon:yes stop_codon:yes gene_type:complete
MTDSPIKVIDQFLPPEVFLPLAYHIMTYDSYRCFDFTTYAHEGDGSIEWFGEKNTNRIKPVQLHETLFSFKVYEKIHNSELINDVYHHQRPQMEVLYEKLNVWKMLLMRVNCTVVAAQNHVGDWHTDLGTHPEEGKSKTCILYLNRNNGGTKFKETGEFVQSEPNRAVIFPGTMEHAGVWHTDKKLRFVLNINYVENDGRTKETTQKSD